MRVRLNVVMAMVLVSFSILQGQAAQDKLPAGVVAAHLVGRLAWNGIDFEMFGYFSFLEGFEAPLFKGVPGEQTARLSFRTERFGLSAIPNGSTLHIRRTPTSDGSTPALKLYFNPDPHGDLDRPATFSDGQLIGVWRAHATQGILVPRKMFKLDGSVELESAPRFTIDGHIMSIENLIHRATLTFSGVPPSEFELLHSTRYSIPFSATAIAADDLDYRTNFWDRWPK